jgi:hypothetical protein
MVAVSLSYTRGVLGQLQTLPGGTGGVVVGTAAPMSSYDFEFRYNSTDQNGNAVTKLDLQLVLRAIQGLLVESGMQQPAGTYTVPTPVL